MMKKDGVKFNTIPNGKAIVGIVLGLTVLIVFLGLVLLPKPEGIALLGISAIFVLWTIILYLNKYSNVLIFTNEKIALKKQSILWNEVHLTIYCRGPNIMRNSFDIYAYFDDHYLTENEIRSKAVKKKGLYLILNYERAEYILFRYPKKVEVLNTPPIDRGGVMSMITMHNEKFS